MESRKFTENVSDLSDNVRDYVHLRVDLLKLLIAEKASYFGSFVMVAIIFFILSLFILMFFSLAFILWYGHSVGPAYVGALIVTAVYILLAVAMYLMRHKLFINPLVSEISRILMEEEDEKQR
jgi:hypothetical protein